MMNIKKLMTAVAVGMMSVMAVAAPFNKTFLIQLSDGNSYQIHGEGDEIDAVFETLDGYTLLTKDVGDACYYYYAVQSTNGTLVASNIEVGSAAQEFLDSLQKHLRDTSDSYADELEKRIEEHEAETHELENWENVKNAEDDETIDDEQEDEVVVPPAIEDTPTETISLPWWKRLLIWLGWIDRPAEAAKAPMAADAKVPFGTPPKVPTLGAIQGLVIMVDFPISGSSETEAERYCPNIDKEMVEESFNGDDSGTIYNPTVWQFYDMMSCHKMSFKNTVINYVLLDKPKSYYNNISQSCGTCGKKLIKDVFAKLQAQPNYESQIYPLLQKLSYDSKKCIRSLSVLFAGPGSSKWSYGLWAHKSTISGLPTIVAEDGTKMRFLNYQVSALDDFDVGKSHILWTGTICHECGHMVCDFPDLYDYDKQSHGVGSYSYMANGSVADPYLAYKAGWIEPKEITSTDEVLKLVPDYKTVYKYTNPSNAKEYYLVKYANGEGIDTQLPGKGILVYRCNEGGNNTHSSFIGIGRTNNKYRRSYELSIVQADGTYHLERRMSGSGDNDFYTDDDEELSDITVPNCSWKDNSKSFFSLSEFEVHSDYATCRFQSTLPRVEVKTRGFDGKYDKKSHRITMTKINPKSGMTVKYSKTKEGPFKTSNPTYIKPGEYTTYFQASKRGYMTTNGCEKVIIR